MGFSINGFFVVAVAVRWLLLLLWLLSRDDGAREQTDAPKKHMHASFDKRKKNTWTTGGRKYAIYGRRPVLFLDASRPLLTLIC